MASKRPEEDSDEEDNKPKEHPMEALMRKRYEKARKDEEELNQHPLFATAFPEAGKENDAFKALKALIDETPPEELAENLKNSGNEAYRMGRDRWEDAIGYYSDALDKKCSDEKLNSVIFSNRAQVHLSLGNYGHALSDAKCAIERDNRNGKAYFRAAKAARMLMKLDEAGVHCRTGLAVGKTPELEALYREIMDLRRKEAERLRQLHAAQRQKEEMRRRVLQIIYERNLRIGPNVYDCVVNEAHKEKLHYDDESKSLHWPVLFLYPEFFQSDFIQDFDENHSLLMHLDTMFPPNGQPAPWDQRGIYHCDHLRVYYEIESPTQDPAHRKLREVDVNAPLKDILQNDDFVINGDIPAFHIVVKDTPYDVDFRTRYRSVLPI
eukprot:TRINITY_DN15134_c0_g1_i4.p1 TRINITY_DN15134_c0_g1~~TRINITY_DN15134_c0_g1_i4.p1  ORF type:complete len:380 (+),score=74.23 TRINITY_DN15134_c0_g1_i4:54-1193(+)